MLVKRKVKNIHLDFLIFMAYNMLKITKSEHLSRLSMERIDYAMKKFLIIISIPIIIALLFTARNFYKEPEIEQESEPVVTVTPTAEPEAPTKTPEPTPDPRDEEESIRAEIQQKLKDIEDLIAEDMTDDAKMMIENLETFELNQAEQKRLDEIKKSLISISD